ncbi:MAG: hypothetical protein PF630_02440 [Gammaproteobacteria bacterium]|jgi:hypothetical protein|nr:hypothetical protein [Gammaproteobacteria bacterium]
MKVLLPILFISALSLSGCAGNDERTDQGSSAADSTELRCVKRAHSGSRLGVSKCTRVSVEKGG